MERRNQRPEDQISKYINKALDIAITEAVEAAVRNERARIKEGLYRARLTDTPTVVLEDVVGIVEDSIEVVGPL